MIYFDNAATCGKKPDVVNKKLESLIKSAGVNVGRGVYADAKKAEETVFNCRSFLSKTVNNGHIARLIFTFNCTHALNQMIFGVNLKGTEIVTSVTEHNSVLRPLYRTQNQDTPKPSYQDKAAVSRVDTRYSSLPSQVPPVYLRRL